MKNLFYYIQTNETFAKCLTILCIILLVYYWYLSRTERYKVFTVVQKISLATISIAISFLMIIISIAYIGILGIILLIVVVIGVFLILIAGVLMYARFQKISSTMERINQKYVSPIFEFDRNLDLSISENLDIHNKINDISDQYLNLIRYLIDTNVEKQIGEEYDQIMEELHKIEKMYSDIYTYFNKDRKPI